MASLLLYGRLASASVRSQAQYRFSFALVAVGQFLISFLDFVGVLIVFEHVPALAGWTLPEVGFLFGSAYLVFKLVDVAVGNIEYLPAYIRIGLLDTMLVRPLGALGQVVTAQFSLRTAGGAFQGLLVLVWALGRVDVEWTPGRVVVFGLMLASAAVIFASVFVAANAVTFWLIDSREFANAFTYGGNAFSSYPLQIFARWLQRLLTFVIPVAFVGYFPALYLLQKPPPAGAPAVLRFASPVAAAAAALAARAIWRLAVRHYRSTGS